VVDQLEGERAPFKGQDPWPFLTEKSDLKLAAGAARTAAPAARGDQRDEWLESGSNEQGTIALTITPLAEDACSRSWLQTIMK
jgi:hypothetical protein